MEGLLAHLLAHDRAAWLDPDDHAAALAVGEGADGLQRLAQLARRALDLERDGLALGDEGVEDGKGVHEGALGQVPVTPQRSARDRSGSHSPGR